MQKTGAEVYAYDPVGMDNFKRKYPEVKHGAGSIHYAENIEEALEDANVCFIFTEWPQIKAIKPTTFKELMRTPLVYDGRNIYGIEEMKAAGVEYYSIGREQVTRASINRFNNLRERMDEVAATIQSAGNE